MRGRKAPWNERFWQLAMMTNTNAHTNANANANTDDDDNIFVSEDVICEGASLLGEKVSNQLLKVRCRAFCYQLSAKTH